MAACGHGAGDTESFLTASVALLATIAAVAAAVMTAVVPAAMAAAMAPTAASMSASGVPPAVLTM